MKEGEIIPTHILTHADTLDSQQALVGSVCGSDDGTDTVDRFGESAMKNYKRFCVAHY